MIPLLPVTFAAGATAAAVPWLLPMHQGLAYGLLAGGYLGALAHGSFAVRSRLLGPACCRLLHTQHAVALTYDDGPDAAATPRLLDLLREHRARATFFLVGERVRALPALAQRIHDEGHALGNHGDRHSWSAPFHLRPGLRADLQACQLAIQAATGLLPRWFRPPFGVRTHATHGVCAELGLQVVGWSVRSLDLPGCDPERACSRVLARLRGGAIVLLHDGGRAPAQVEGITARLLAAIAARGLRPVALDPA